MEFEFDSQIKPLGFWTTYLGLPVSAADHN